MEIVGFGYRKGVGKDFCTNYLVQHYGFRRLGFADPLKNALREIFGFTEEQLYGSLKEVVDPYWGFSPRWCLQHFGTETMREFFGPMCVQEGFWDPREKHAIWIKAAVRKLHQYREQGVPGVAFSDVRFLNEYNTVRKEGGVLVKIIRPVELLDNPVQGTHASEAGLESMAETGWDLILRNVNNDYIEVLDSLMEHLGIPKAHDRC